MRSDVLFQVIDDAVISSAGHVARSWLLIAAAHTSSQTMLIPFGHHQFSWGMPMHTAQPVKATGSDTSLLRGSCQTEVTADWAAMFTGDFTTLPTAGSSSLAPDDGSAEGSSWLRGPFLQAQQPQQPQQHSMQRQSQPQTQHATGAAATAGAYAQATLDGQSAFAGFPELQMDDDLDELFNWPADAELLSAWSHDPCKTLLGPPQHPTLELSINAQQSPQQAAPAPVEYTTPTSALVSQPPCAQPAGFNAQQHGGARASAGSTDEASAHSGGSPPPPPHVLPAHTSEDSCCTGSRQGPASETDATPAKGRPRRGPRRSAASSKDASCQLDLLTRKDERMREQNRRNQADCRARKKVRGLMP